MSIDTIFVTVRLSRSLISKALIFRIVFEFVKDEQVSPADGNRTHSQPRRRTDLDPGRLPHQQLHHQCHHQHGHHGQDGHHQQ